MFLWKTVSISKTNSLVYSHFPTFQYHLCGACARALVRLHERVCLFSLFVVSETLKVFVLVEILSEGLTDEWKR